MLNKDVTRFIRVFFWVSKGKAELAEQKHSEEDGKQGNKKPGISSCLRNTTKF